LPRVKIKKKQSQ